MGWIACLFCASALNSCTRVATESGHISLDAVCTANSVGQTSIKVTIKNGTADHLSVAVGVILGNGDRLADAVSLQIAPVGAADPETYVYSDPRHPGVAGRMDPWRLEVRPGGLRMSTLTRDTFYRPGQGDASRQLEGDVRVRLRGLGSQGHELSPAWTGTVESQPMRMPDNCKSSDEK